jgi:micrococcal nuclease
MKGFILIVSLSFIYHSAAAVEEFVSRVITVIDGNTFEVMDPDNQLRRLVLAGVDSPEPGQPFSDKAKKVLEKLILEKEVRIQIEGKNRVGNYLVVISIVKSGIDPRVELLEKGLAWTSEKNPVSELEAIRLKAAEKGKGLWKDQNPIAPWIYRRQQSMLQAKSS